MGRLMADLDEMIKSLERQRDEHFAIYHQAVGALAACAQFKSMQKDHITTEELGAALGGTVEAIEKV